MLTCMIVQSVNAVHFLYDPTDLPRAIAGQGPGRVCSGHSPSPSSGRGKKVDDELEADHSLDIVRAIPQRWTGGTWDELTRYAHEVFGADLEKGATLIGVPHCLIQATFRPGDFADKNGERGFYVSLDAIIAPQADLDRARRRKRMAEDSDIEPGEHLVYNEGGTGVYRQIVAYLESQNRIKINSDLPRDGRYGESRFDISPRLWEVGDDAEFRISPVGDPTLGFSIRLLCPRGLRSSDYENEFTKQGVTRYIA